MLQERDKIRRYIKKIRQDALFWIQIEIVTYSSVSENIYMDKKNNHDSLFIVSREPKLRFSADHRGYQIITCLSTSFSKG